MANLPQSVIRRQIVEEVGRGKYSPALLAQLAAYDKSAQLMVKESMRLERPIDVASVGAGDMWDLKVLISGMPISKPDILRSYTGVDYVRRANPFGKNLSKLIEFKSYAQDLNEDPTLPNEDNSVDLVICTEFIEHIDYYPACSIIHEISCILRPGGLLFLTTANADNKKPDKHHPHEWQLKGILGELEGNLLHPCNTYGTVIDQKAFNDANADWELMGEALVDVFKNSLTPNFYRMMLATLYPEHSKFVAIEARKAEYAR